MVDKLVDKMAMEIYGIHAQIDNDIPHGKLIIKDEILWMDQSTHDIALNTIKKCERRMMFNGRSTNV
jgi:hypothetical protein